MFTKIMSSSSHFCSTTELAQNPFLPPSSYDTLPRAEKRSIVIENDGATTMQPPLKRLHIEATETTATPFHRLPCKARGMSNTHNSETAFIDVPINAPHGLLLSCSNAECFHSGRKFRYCKVCVLPVAKRNFPKRHGHGLIHFAKDLKEVDFMSSFVTPTTALGTVCQPCDPSKIISQQAQFQIGGHDVCTVDVEKSRQKNHMYAQKMKPPLKMSRPSISLVPDEKDWIALLHERPNLEEQDEMSKWMDKVIGFSTDLSSARSAQQCPQRISYRPATPTTSSTTNLTPKLVTPMAADPLISIIGAFPSKTPELLKGNHLGKPSMDSARQPRPIVDGIDPVFATVDMRLFE